MIRRRRQQHHHHQQQLLQTAPDVNCFACMPIRISTLCRLCAFVIIAFGLFAQSVGCCRGYIGVDFVQMLCNDCVGKGF